MPCKIDKQDGNNFCHNTGFWQNQVCPEDKEKCGYWEDDRFDVGLSFLKEPTEEENWACMPFGGYAPGYTRDPQSRYYDSEVSLKLKIKVELI